MIFVALGANLPSARYGPPRATLAAALELLAGPDIRVAGRSSWYQSAPVPPSDQPWFVNAVTRLETECAPDELLRRLHDVEAALGRVRGDTPNAARAADLDLLDYHGRVTDAQAWPRLPHPRLHERAFVVRPLAELAPDWRHPVSGESVQVLAGKLPPDQACVRMSESVSPDSERAGP